MPFMFASCTQDVLESEMVQGNVPNAKGFKLEIKVDEEKSADTRSYNANDLAMQFKAADGDKLSMFWLGDDPDDPTPSAYKQSFNSVFNIEKEGDGENSSFRSPSMVYSGYNVVVYPADITTVATGDILLEVENDNSKNGIKNYPFISNLLNLDYSQTSNGKNENWLTSGYNNSLVLPLKQAANYAEINLNVQNIVNNVVGYENGVEIESIIFNANGSHFAETANIKTHSVGVTTNGKFDADKTNGFDWHTPIVKSTYAVAKSTTDEIETKNVAVTHNEDKTAATGTGYLMTFPTQAYAENFGTAVTSGEIKVKTNMGTVTLVTGETKLVEGNTTYPNSPVLHGSNKVSIESWMNGMSTYRIQKDTKSKFAGEIIGTRFARTLNVDMTQAKLDGSVVETSADIIRYIELHKQIKSSETVTLVLSKKVGDEGVDFAGLTEAAVKALAGADKFKLNINGNSTIKLLGGGNVQNFMLIADKFVSAPATYELAAAEWTAAEGLNTKVSANIINSGVLTISEAAEKNFDVALTNNGTVKLADGATVVFGAEYTANEGSTTSVRASAIMKFIENATINGNVTVNNDFIAAETAIVTFGKTAKVTNNDFISTNGENAKIINLGTITVAKDNTHTLITANENNTDKGTIVLNSRDNEVSVGVLNDKGYISILASKIGNTYEFAEGDKMNKIILDQDGKFTFKTNSKIAYVDVEANASIINGTGEEKVVFAGLKVAENMELTVSSGNAVKVKPASIEDTAWGALVRCEGTTIAKNAKIIVAGKFEYGTCSNKAGFYQAGAGVVKP